MNISDEASVQHGYDRVTEQGWDVDVIVANADVQLFGWDAPIADLDLATWRQTIDFNLTVSRGAAGLRVFWHTADTAILSEGQRRLIDHPRRFQGVSTIGVDEYVWRNTRRGDRFVTVIIDLAPIRDKTGPARLLNMVEGRSKQVFKDWIQSRPQACRPADREAEARMIAVGNRRMRGIGRVLGSVANSVAHSASCDVYIANTYDTE